TSGSGGFNPGSGLEFCGVISRVLLRSGPRILCGFERKGAGALFAPISKEVQFRRCASHSGSKLGGPVELPTIRELSRGRSKRNDLVPHLRVAPLQGQVVLGSRTLSSKEGGQLCLQ